VRATEILFTLFAQRMNRLLLVILGAFLVVATLLGVWGVLPGGSGVVARRVLPDGTEILVTQTYGTGELGYEIGFYFKEPNTAWGWCYLDHEDTEWRHGRIEYDASSDTVTIWKGSTIRGRLHRRSKDWERPDVKGWHSPAPQEMRNPPFA
jgi:hypothetical protein